MAKPNLPSAGATEAGCRAAGKFVSLATDSYSVDTQVLNVKYVELGKVESKTQAAVSSSDTGIDLELFATVEECCVLPAR